MITILPTIDVEGVHGTDPFKQMILGEIGMKETWGVYHLANIFRQWNISATFFIDCYEHVLWGEPLLEKVCVDLVELGQDVQLHTHPSWRNDRRDYPALRELKKKSYSLPQNKDFMAKLSRSEQIEVLQHGIELLEKWTGVKPIAHRSGGYSANQDTIESLAEVGIPIDSSMFRGHSNSQLDWGYNRVIERNGVIEVPVTCFHRLWVKRHMKVKLPAESMCFKTDVDVASLRELIHYIEYSKQFDLKVMNLFMHSYSLIKCDNRFLKFSPEIRDANKLKAFLEKMSSDQDVRFMSMTQFLKRFQDYPDEFAGADMVPEIPALSELSNLCLKKASRVCFSWIGSLAAKHR